MRLEARDLAFGYRGHPVGRDVSLALEAGEVLCLLGPNGGGKTTLFKTLLGLLPPQEGAVLIDGRDAQLLTRDAIARRISYVPQAHGAFFPYTVCEVVLMGRTAHLGLFAAPSARDHAAALDAIRRMGITHLANTVYTQISGGERQLALIARALAQDARMVIMDEPTANLDFGNQVRVLERIRALAGEGIGVLLSTHDPDHAFLCADRVAMLHEGKLMTCGAVSEVMTTENLRRLYGVEVAVTAVSLGGCAGGETLPGPQFDVPAGPGIRWFKGNTHTHTLESDGDATPEVVAQWYKSHGYQFLVLSDHNVFTDPARLARMVDSTFLLIGGEELTSAFERRPVHVNGLNLHEMVEAQTDSTLQGTIQKNVDAVRAVRGTPHINHPNFQWAFGARELLAIRNDPLLEIWNGHPTVHNAGGNGSPGLEAIWDELLTAGEANLWHCGGRCPPLPGRVRSRPSQSGSGMDRHPGQPTRPD